MVLVTRITEPAFPGQYLCGLDLFEGLTVFGHSQGLLLEYLTAHMAVYHLSPSYSIGRIDTPTSVTEDNPDNLPQSSMDIVPKGDMVLEVGSATYRMRVQSRVLCLASGTFKAMLENTGFAAAVAWAIQ